MHTFALIMWEIYDALSCQDMMFLLLIHPSDPLYHLHFELNAFLTHPLFNNLHPISSALSLLSIIFADNPHLCLRIPSILFFICPHQHQITFFQLCDIIMQSHLQKIPSGLDPIESKAMEKRRIVAVKTMEAMSVLDMAAGAMEQEEQDDMGAAAEKRSKRSI